MAAGLEQRSLKLGSAAMACFTSQEVCLASNLRTKINLFLPIDYSVEWKYSWQVCCWKASSEWSNSDSQSLLQSESQPTTVILQWFLPLVPWSPCKKFCISRQHTFCESSCGIKVLCFSVLFLLFKAICFPERKLNPQGNIWYTFPANAVCSYLWNSQELFYKCLSETKGFSAIRIFSYLTLI